MCTVLVVEHTKARHRAQTCIALSLHRKRRIVMPIKLFLPLCRLQSLDVAPPLQDDEHRVHDAYRLG